MVRHEERRLRWHLRKVRALHSCTSACVGARNTVDIWWRFYSGFRVGEVCVGRWVCVPAVRWAGGWVGGWIGWGPSAQVCGRDVDFTCIDEN